MTDKEIEELAEKGAYKAISSSKIRMKLWPMWRWGSFALGVFFMLCGADDNCSILLMIVGAILAFHSFLILPLVNGFFEAEFENEKAAAIKRLKNERATKNGSKNHS